MTVVAEAVTVEVASVVVLVAADVVAVAVSVAVAVAVTVELDWASPSPMNRESAPSTAGRGSNMVETVQDLKSTLEWISEEREKALQEEPVDAEDDGETKRHIHALI